jgi:biotin carboxyl carrier protein
MKPVPKGDLKTFKVDCQTYQTRLTKKFESRRVWEKPDRREVFAYIPGSVVKVMVKEGDSLAAGAALLTFEAMKMECTLTMPYDGVVKKIHVQPGDRFPKSKILVEIDD